MWAKGNKKKKAAAHLGISGVYLAASYLMLNFPLKDLPFVGFFALLLLIPLSHWMPLDSEKEAISFEEGNIATFGVQIINIAATLFFFSFTFISLGRSSVHDNELTTFVKDNKEYAIVKVYDENVFTWSVVNGKIIRHLTYFRMENINGLEFNQKKFKSDIKNKE